MFEAGMPRAVAICGTSLAEEHFRLLRRFARRVVLALDADGAGQGAAEKFYEWERRHEVEVVVAALPPGTDPAELGQRDPAALRAAVEGARSFLGFRVDRVLSEGDLSSPESRARVAEVALGLVAEHPSELVRDPYVMRIGALCRIEDSQLRVVLERIRRTAKSSPATPHPDRNRVRQGSAVPRGSGTSSQRPAAPAPAAPAAPAA
ncbi:MAG: toprim domain-containing protein, partial [Acidimicrobiales bacterium]